MPAMKKRIVAAVLWFYAGWYLGDAIAYMVGLGPAFGIILATACAAVVAGDPRGLIWSRGIARRVARPIAASPEPQG